MIECFKPFCTCTTDFFPDKIYPKMKIEFVSISGKSEYIVGQVIELAIQCKTCGAYMTRKTRA